MDYTSLLGLPLEAIMVIVVGFYILELAKLIIAKVGNKKSDEVNTLDSNPPKPKG
ncbi:hypothetical protein PSET11_03042 [Arthrobacter ulcerisalmonis]|uniref:Uncharacterized protein n=1 Tax=Arthrobacter ulcerisalmonis TaxID=2483813 RepID=A0A3P5XC51_9MICC|nr:hypothetical protein PSET11_03042 [Arthrobacter ulcerisalmonis]